MKNILSKLTLLGFLSFSLFTFAQTAVDDIPYKLAKNYFVRNDYPDKEIHIFRITSQKKFDDIFGAATLMGEEGKPTEIDFTKSDVIALINDSSNNIADLKINSLKQTKGKINLNYSFSQTAAQSYQSRHFALLIVDKKYTGALSAMRTAGDTPLVGSDINEFGCKPSTGYTWSVINNKCIQIFAENGKTLTGSIGKTGLIFSTNKKEAELIFFQYGEYPQNVVLKNVPKSKIWKNGNLSLSLVKEDYILRDKKTELAKGK